MQNVQILSIASIDLQQQFLTRFSEIQLLNDFIPLVVIILSYTWLQKTHQKMFLPHYIKLVRIVYKPHY